MRIECYVRFSKCDLKRLTNSFNVYSNGSPSDRARVFPSRSRIRTMPPELGANANLDLRRGLGQSVARKEKK